MVIDSRFRVIIDYVSAQGNPRTMHIRASDFFEADDYDEIEWGCDLPWRFANLSDYLSPDEMPFQEVKLRITDRQTNQEKAVYIRELNGIHVTISWDDRCASPGRFEIILDIRRNESQSVSEIARLDVDETDVKLTTHVLIEGDECRSFIADE